MTSHKKSSTSSLLENDYLDPYSYCFSRGYVLEHVADKRYYS